MVDTLVTEAHLARLFLGSILFGLHLVSFGFCMKTLVWAKLRWGDVNWPMVLVSFVLISNATFDTVLDFQQAVKAFVLNEAHGGPMEIYLNISSWTNVSKSVTVVVQTMIGDAMLIYRCWIIYSKSWRMVAVLIMLWLGCLGATLWVIYLEATLHSRLLVTASNLRPAGIIFWGLTISLNVLTTSLLVRRVWKIGRQGQLDTLCGEYMPESRRLLRNVIRIIVESGLLYSITALITFITFVCKSNAIYVITGAEIQIVGVAFNLIIIRAATLATRDQTVLPGSLSFMRSPPLHSTQGDAVSNIKFQMKSSSSLAWDASYNP